MDNKIRISCMGGKLLGAKCPNCQVDLVFDPKPDEFNRMDKDTKTCKCGKEILVSCVTDVARLKNGQDERIAEARGRMEVAKLRDKAQIDAIMARRNNGR
jgi:hypothetical protein